MYPFYILAQPLFVHVWESQIVLGIFPCHGVHLSNWQLKKGTISHSIYYLFLVIAPGDPAGMLNVFRQPGPMGPRGVQGPHMRPDMPPHFQGPGGPRQGGPMGPLFPGPEGPMMGPRMRGPMPPRMQGGHGVVRGMVPGPRPLLPEMVSFSLFFTFIIPDIFEFLF